MGLVHSSSKRIAVLTGPTGAGKSAAALEIAAACPAVIINADAMQMVGALRVMTARPTELEEATAEHALYGVLCPEEPTSVALWLKQVEPVIRNAWAQEKLPLIVGGTGMYVKALMEGLVALPPIAQTLRDELRLLDAATVRMRLEQKDPIMANRLNAGDSQRVLRALEVVEATGISLADWQERPTAPLFPDAQYRSFAMRHPREEIYCRIDGRFHAMLERGGLDEVRALMALRLPSHLPILRAHGVPELTAYLKGESSLDAAIKKSQQNTRNYAKRQMTWARHQLPGALPVTDTKSILAGLEGY